MDVAKLGLETIKENSYIVLNVPGGPTSCPEGTQKEMLRCLGSFFGVCPPQIKTALNRKYLEKDSYSLKTFKLYPMIYLINLS